MKLLGCYSTGAGFVACFEDDELNIVKDGDNFIIHWEGYWSEYDVSFNGAYDTVKRYGVECQFLDWLMGKDFDYSKSFFIFYFLFFWAHKPVCHSQSQRRGSAKTTPTRKEETPCTISIMVTSGQFAST